MDIFGWDLPPGCSVSDIPGNRPEDVEWERIEEAFYTNEPDKYGRKRFTDKQWKYLGSKNRSQYLEEIITIALDYGIELGRAQMKEELQQDKEWREANDVAD
jgi:hypothetical protein